MWTSVILLPIRALSCAAALALLIAAPALARDKKPPRPVTDDHVSAGDVAATPIDDLNLRDKAIPEVLQRAALAPYARDGLDDCDAIATAVGELDAVLGDDSDIAGVKVRKADDGRLAQSALGLLIPLRPLIREASGASGARRRMADAIITGAMRRAYLKGIGEERGCPYPARPADAMTRAVIADIAQGVNNPAPEPVADPPAEPLSTEPAAPIADPVFSPAPEPASPD